MNEKEARSKVAAYTWKHRNHVETASAERIEAYRYFEAKGFLAALSTCEASLKEKAVEREALYKALWAIHTRVTHGDICCTTVETLADQISQMASNVLREFPYGYTSTQGQS